MPRPRARTIHPPIHPKGKPNGQGGAPVLPKGAFKIPPPRASGGLSDEAAMFSGGDEAVITGKRAARGDVSAALARMHGAIDDDVLPDDDELDALGEAGQQEELLEVEGRPLTKRELFDIDAYIQEEVGRRVAEHESEAAQVRHRTLLAGSTMPTPIPPSMVAVEPPGLTFRAITVEDIDRLWDWIRIDGDGGQAFLGREIHHSIELHAFIADLARAEHDHHTAMLRALYYENDELKTYQHIGFGMLAPMIPAERMALMHLYLTPEGGVRGSLPAITASFVELASQLAPGYRLATVPASEELLQLHRALLLPLGFVAHTMFVR